MERINGVGNRKPKTLQELKWEKRAEETSADTSSITDDVKE